MHYNVPIRVPVERSVTGLLEIAITYERFADPDDLLGSSDVFGMIYIYMFVV